MLVMQISTGVSGWRLRIQHVKLSLQARLRLKIDTTASIAEQAAFGNWAGKAVASIFSLNLTRKYREAPPTHGIEAKDWCFDCSLLQ